MATKRMAIYTTDIERITGKGDRYARRILSSIRRQLNKEKHQVVTIKELCTYLDLEETEVVEFLSKR